MPDGSRADDAERSRIKILIRDRALAILHESITAALEALRWE